MNKLDAKESRSEDSQKVRACPSSLGFTNKGAIIFIFNFNFYSVTGFRVKQVEGGLAKAPVFYNFTLRMQKVFRPRESLGGIP